MSTISKSTWEEIYACSKNQFMLVMTAADLATPSLFDQPPFVMVNSVQYEPNLGSLLRTICQAYTGSPLPPSCLSHSLNQ